MLSHFTSPPFPPPSILYFCFLILFHYFLFFSFYMAMSRIPPLSLLHIPVFTFFEFFILLSLCFSLDPYSKMPLLSTSFVNPKIINPSPFSLRVSLACLRSFDPDCSTQTKTFLSFFLSSLNSILIWSSNKTTHNQQNQKSLFSFSFWINHILK